jgi:hypothetical protein
MYLSVWWPFLAPHKTQFFFPLAVTDLFMTVQCGRVCYGPDPVTECKDGDPYTTEDDCTYVKVSLQHKCE